MRDKAHYLHKHALELGSLDAYIEDPVAQKTISNFQARMLALNFDVSKYFQGLSEDQRRQWHLEQHLETADLGLQEDHIYKLAQSKLNTFFLVGITEQFPLTLALMCKHLNWSYPQDRKDQNMNAERPRREQIDSNTLMRLQSLNAVDIALYAEARLTFEKKIEELVINLVCQQSGRSFLSRLFS
jgi:hypothetical protein